MPLVKRFWAFFRKNRKFCVQKPPQLDIFTFLRYTDSVKNRKEEKSHHEILLPVRLHIIRGRRALSRMRRTVRQRGIRRRRHLRRQAVGRFSDTMLFCSRDRLSLGVFHAQKELVLNKTRHIRFCRRHAAVGGGHLICDCRKDRRYVAVI